MFNTVKVTLNNEEFGKISTKEVEVAKYLDLLHTVRIAKDGDDKQLSFDDVLSISDIDHSIETVRNKQSQPTPLCKPLLKTNNFVVGEQREMLRLTQV